MLKIDNNEVLDFEFKDNQTLFEDVLIIEGENNIETPSSEVVAFLKANQEYHGNDDKVINFDSETNMAEEENLITRPGM